MIKSTGGGSPDKKPHRPGEKCLFYLGAAALLFAMGVETVAVLGRHIGLPLWGSIEMVQAAILLASSSAVLSATIAGKHVKVRILMDRLKGRTGILLRHLQTLFCILFFCGLTVGSIWIFLDLRNGFEESEVLHIPYTPLRLVSIASVLAVALNYLRRLTGSRDHD